MDVRTDVLGLVGGGFTEAIETGQMSLVIAMGKVEAGNVHTGINESLQLVDIPTGGSKRTHHLALAASERGGLFNRLQVNKATGQGRNITRIRNHFIYLSLFTFIQTMG
jgi:hypothetical protein